MVEKIACDNGCTLAYTDYGDRDGYPVLVHHGLVGSIAHPELGELLAGRHVRFINIARPGYGESPICAMQSYADWPGMVMPLINKLGLDSFDVLGMSAGAPYCYALAALLPGQVRRVFIYSGIPALLEAGMLDSYPDRQKAAEEFDFYRQADPADIAKALKEMYLAGLPGEVLEQIDFRDSMANGCLGMARETKLQSRDWGFSFTDIRQPVFMQHSKTDEEVPFAAALATSALLSDCELHVLPEAPHLSEDALLGFFDRMINRINEGQ